MANRATSEGVRADMQPPNYRGAVQRIRTIPAKRDKISSVNGEIADIYAKIEGMKVNRKGAKLFYMLDRLDPEERVDVLRSLNGLCDASGWDETSEDLMDKAEGNVVHMRVGQTGTGDAEEEPGLEDGQLDGDDGHEEFEEASAEELAQQAGRADATVDKAKGRARGQLDKAKAPEEPATGTGAAAMKAMNEAAKPKNVIPFTGDNSDLANTEPKGAA